MRRVTTAILLSNLAKGLTAIKLRKNYYKANTYVNTPLTPPFFKKGGLVYSSPSSLNL